MINYHCRNNHKGENIPIKDFISLSIKEFKDILCKYCSLNYQKNIDIKLYYCYKCQKFICESDKNKHEAECKNNILIELEKIDLTCLIHGNNLSHFCNDCKISVCDLCKEHKNHNKNTIDELNFKDWERKDLLTEIENNLNNLEKIYNKIKNVLFKKITDVYEINKNLLQFNKILLESLNNNEINGEINDNAINSFYIKSNNIEKSLKYYKDNFEILEDYFKNDFFEFDIEEQKKLSKYRRNIPIEVSFSKEVPGFFGGFKELNIVIKKFFSPDTTISFISYYFRNIMKVEPHEVVYLLAEKKHTLCGDITLPEVYEKYKRNDGILYLHLQIGELRW